MPLTNDMDAMRQDEGGSEPTVPMRDVGGEYERRLQRGDRKGAVTSVLALILAIATLALSLGGVATALSIPIQIDDFPALKHTLKLLIVAIMASLCSLIVMVPTILIGLRSASKPKGHAGRGRGLFSVIIGATVPVTCLFVILTFSLMRANSDISRITSSGLVSRTEPDSDGRVRIVTPGGTATVNGNVADALDDLGLLPENVVADDGTIPISAHDRTIYVGEEPVSPDTIQGLIGTHGTPVTESQLGDVADQVERLSDLGYSMGIDDTGRIVATDPRGNSVSIDMDDGHNLRVDASTDIDIDTVTKMAEQLSIPIGSLPLP